MASFIYIHGHLRADNLTVAKELCKLIPKAKVVDDNLLIDPAAAIFEPTAEEYQPLRKELRRNILMSIVKAESARGITWIFIDQQSSSENKVSLAVDYEYAATMCSSPLISIILKRNSKEVFKRATMDSRDIAANNAKLPNIENIRSISEREGVFRFRNIYELELDVTRLSSITAAESIGDHIRRVKRIISTGKEYPYYGI